MRYNKMSMIIINTNDRAKNDMVIDPLIGTRIRYIRELNHYTREELAEYEDISQKSLHEIENGQKRNV